MEDARSLIDAYRADTNGGRGWLVRSSWKSSGTVGPAAPPEVNSEWPTLGEARDAGRRLSCIAGVTGVDVLPAGEPSRIACRYRREDNLWRDRHPDIARAEALMTQLDVSDAMSRATTA